MKNLMPIDNEAISEDADKHFILNSKIKELEREVNLAEGDKSELYTSRILKAAECAKEWRGYKFVEKLKKLDMDQPWKDNLKFIK